jgi:hypothetical protein
MNCPFVASKRRCTKSIVVNKRKRSFRDIRSVEPKQQGNARVKLLGFDGSERAMPERELRRAYYERRKTTISVPTNVPTSYTEIETRDPFPHCMIKQVMMRQKGYVSHAV